jgi:hypothetical protein
LLLSHSHNKVWEARRGEVEGHQCRCRCRCVAYVVSPCIIRAGVALRSPVYVSTFVIGVRRRHCRRGRRRLLSVE